HHLHFRDPRLFSIFLAPVYDNSADALLRLHTYIFFFFSSRRRHTRSVSAFLLNRSSDLVYCCRHCLLCSSRQHSNGLSHHGRRDRKSGSAGMPRPISYAVFCLKKKRMKAAPVDADKRAAGRALMATARTSQRRDAGSLWVRCS